MSAKEAQPLATSCEYAYHIAAILNSVDFYLRHVL